MSLVKGSMGDFVTVSLKRSHHLCTNIFTFLEGEKMVLVGKVWRSYNVKNHHNFGSTWALPCSTDVEQHIPDAVQNTNISPWSV